MGTRNIVLTEHQSALVDQLVKSGRYQNASEVLRAGLRLIEEAEANHTARVKALREAIADGLADIEAGRYQEFTGPEFSEYLDCMTEKILEENLKENKVRQ